MHSQDFLGAPAGPSTPSAPLWQGAPGYPPPSASDPAWLTITESRRMHRAGLQVLGS